MNLPIYQVDAFSDRPFHGNPAAVSILPGPADESWMQAVAREMNLSETAFLVPAADGFNLRWFTPLVEVALCGHATLASAHILWETNRLPPGAAARFHTMSGLLTAEKKTGWIEMNFPARNAAPAPLPAEVGAALGVEARYTGRNEYDFLVEVASEEIVRAIKPDYERLSRLPVRGVIVTAAASTPDFDFVSRFFAPNVGVNEDPVTGSAHCCLGPYWAGRLGKSELTAFQASARGGILRLRLDGNRVIIAGQAVTVLHGELIAPHFTARID